MPRADSDIRKQQIIAAAAAVFARKGFDGASMEEIVQASGLSKGGLYWHFKSKDAIITAVLDQFFTAELAEAAQLLASPQPAADRLRRLIAQLVADTESELSAYLAIWLEFYAVAARDAAFRDRMRRYLRQFTDVYATLIQQGIDRGEFRPQDPHRAALAVAAQFEGLLLLWTIDPDATELASLSATAVNLLLDGLLIPGAAA